MQSRRKITKKEFLYSYSNGIRNFQDVDFVGDFSGVDFKDAHLKGANFEGVNLKGANLSGMDLMFANFKDADLTGADLRGSRLHSITLIGANLENVKIDKQACYMLLDCAKLGRKQFEDLRKAGVQDFRFVILVGDFFEINFAGVDVKGAMVGETRLEKEQFIRWYAAGFRRFRNLDLIGDFSEVDFRNADLTDVNLQKAKLANAVLEGAKLRREQFEHLYKAGVRNFRSVTLEGDFFWVDLKNADLTGANLQNARLTNAVVEGAKLGKEQFECLYKAGVRNFRSVTLEGDFSWVDLTKADLAGANLQNAILTNAMVHGAKLGKEQFECLYKAGVRDFRNVTFVGDFSKIDFRGSDLRGAILSDVNLTDVNLAHCNLTDVVVDGATLDKEQFEYLCGRRKLSIWSMDPRSIGNGIKNFRNLTLVGDFSGVDLTEINLQNVKLIDFRLQGAKLEKEQFECLYKAGIRDFKDVILVGYFSDVDFKDADLAGAKLESSSSIYFLKKRDFEHFYAAGVRNFRGVNLRGDFSEVNFEGADLSYVDFGGAILQNAKLTGVKVQYAKINAEQFTCLYNAGIRDFKEVAFVGHFSAVDCKGADLAGAHVRSLGAIDTCLTKAAFEYFYAAGVRDFHGVKLEGDFSEVNFEGADLSYVDFGGAILQNAKLTGVKVQYAKINAEQFTCLRVQGVTDFNGVTLRGDLSRFNFEGADLKGAAVEGAILGREDFARLRAAGIKYFFGVTLEGDFLGFDFKGADLRRAKVNAVVLGREEFKYLCKAGVDDFQGVTLVGDFSAVNFGEVDLTGADLQKATLANAVVNRAKLGEEQFVHFYKAGVRDFANVTLKGDISEDVNLDGCWFNRAVVNGATLDKKQFSHLRSRSKGIHNFCNVTLVGDFSEVDFNGAYLHEVKVRDLTIDKAGFMRLSAGGLKDFKGVTLVGNFSGVNFRGVNLAGADLTGADLTGADLTGANWNNAIVTSSYEKTGGSLALASVISLAFAGGALIFTPMLALPAIAVGALFMGGSVFSFRHKKKGKIAGDYILEEGAKEATWVESVGSLCSKPVLCVLAQTKLVDTPEYSLLAKRHHGSASSSMPGSYS